MKKQNVPISPSTTVGIMRLAEQGGAFEWLAEEEDLYTVNDLKVRYR